MIQLTPQLRVFVHHGPTDMRKSFDGLSGLVESAFSQDLLSGHLFVFFNRRRDRVKILCFEGDGLSIWQKRLEAGTFQALSAAPEQTSLEISSSELALLLEGVDLYSVRRRKRWKRPA
jgi:transposase